MISNRNILVVEDDEQLAEVLISMVPAAFVVTWAKNMTEALKALREISFGLVVTDFNFPGGNGDQVASECAQLETRVVLHSSDIDALSDRSTDRLYERKFEKCEIDLFHLLQDEAQLSSFSESLEAA